MHYVQGGPKEAVRFHTKLSDNYWQKKLLAEYIVTEETNGVVIVIETSLKLMTSLWLMIKNVCT